MRFVKLTGKDTGLSIHINPEEVAVIQSLRNGDGTLCTAVQVGERLYAVQENEEEVLKQVKLFGGGL